MESEALNFNNIVKTLYSLPLEDKKEILNLLENNIADSRRNEIADNYKKSNFEYKSNKLKFSSKVNELKKML